MQIKQILMGQETKIAPNIVAEGMVQIPKEEKVGGFMVPIEPAKEVPVGMGSVAQKAKSMTEGHTRNNAEYIAGVMNDDICEKANEKGVDLSKEDEKTIVTVVDKIQMELIESGNEEVTATANLSKAEMLTMTPGAQAAYDMAAELTTPKEETISYLVSNELEPTIGNFYQAQNVAVKQVEQKDETENDPKMTEQIGKHLAIIGVEPTEEAIEIGKKMVAAGIDLTKANFDYYKAVSDVQLPLAEQKVTKAVIDAVRVGRDPAAGMILPQYSWQMRAEKAVDVLQNVTEEDLVGVVEAGKDMTIANLAEAKSAREAGLTVVEKREVSITLKITKARRTLEEARASMTFEANLSLLKKGIHLETDSIEMMIEELKAKEEGLEKILWGNMDETREITNVLDQVKQAPAYLLQSFDMEYTLTQVQELTISVTEEHKVSYAKANGAYEAMMTEVRPDLGDSIQKAFRNVDDILEGLQMEVNESNERAVRILGYNEQEITTENILSVKAKDEQMQSIFSNMTPKVVLGMIREGFNPLDIPLAELNAKAKEMKEQLDPLGADRFSKFLVDLESRGEITKEERDGFVGIFRLLRQIEKSDGAAIGANMATGAEVTMRNLMTQVRTSRTGRINVIADDKVGELQKEATPDLSITQQIEKTYQTSCVGNALNQITPEKLHQMGQNQDIMDMTPEELLQALRQQQADEEEVQENRSRDIREAYRMLNTKEELSNFFATFDVPKSPENILAIQNFLQDRNRLYRTLYKKQKENENILDTLNDIKDDIWEKFSEQVKTPEEMAKAQMTLAEVAEHVMDNMMAAENVENLDIRQLKMMHRQMSILGQMGKKEEYAIPVLVADEMGCVNLKIVRGKEEKGKVSIVTKSETLGKIAAEISINKQGMKGYIVSDSESTTQFLKEKAKALTEDLETEIPDTEVELTYVTSSQLSLTQFYQGSGVSEGEATEVQTKTLYSMARVFLKSLAN
ncbi:hypothetical protein SAMN02910358_01084 [Lachnospiraceae bacterium XBB1006]|nr:hypothetical protein SAMN02910358_01084 [Lachnospiraceae bacterium XBB1006]